MDQPLYSRSRIADALELTDVIPPVKQAFVDKYRDAVQMPSKLYLMFEEHNGDLRTMPAYVPSFDLASVKIVNAHPDNPSQHDLPTVMALLVAIDPETGAPLAVLDGSELTALRTAAASALSTRLFAPGDSTSLGIIGAGEQSRYQVQGQLAEVAYENVLIHDQNPNNAEALREWIQTNYPTVSTTIASDPDELLGTCDVINSLTPVRSPLVESVSGLERSILINAMGADSHVKQEWPEDIQNNFQFVVDDWEQASHSGEISKLVSAGNLTEDDILGTLGQFLTEGNSGANHPILFDSTGLAIQDTAATHAVLESDLDPDTSFNFF